MYVLYILFLMTLLMSLSYETNAPPEPKSIRPDVVAMQMSSWHMAAQTMCRTETCVGGSIDPTEYLNDLVKGAIFATNGYFQTTYDGSTQHLLTSLTGVGMDVGDVNNSTVSSSFHRLLNGGTSSSIGYYDQAENVVYLPSRNYGEATLSIGVAGVEDLSALLFVRVPDRSPVLINKVSQN